MMLDPANYMSRSGPGAQNNFVGDELIFTGYDLARARDGRSSRSASLEDVAYGDDYRYQNENERIYHEQQQRQVLYSRYSDLVYSANEKLRRAKEKGKTSVNLSADEVEALQRSRTPQPRETTPPKTPSKGRSSRSSSAASQTGKKSSKKGSSSRLFSNSSPSSSRNKAPKNSRKSSNGEQGNTAPAPPAFMIAGPDGVPMYAPIGYYPPYPPSPEQIRPSSGGSHQGSRSASSNSRREVTPDYESAYLPYPTRYYSPSADLRPGAPPSTRPPCDDNLRVHRNRSASNVQYGTDMYNTPSSPAAQGRRNVSGPADISYSKVPRMQARSPLGDHASTSAAQQWPLRSDSRTDASPLGSSSSSSDDGNEHGVRVEVLPETHGNGYVIDRRPVGSGGGSSSSNVGVKRRKGKR